MQETLHLINTPFVLPSGTVLKNRLVKSAMSERMADAKGRINTAFPRLYEQWAMGGVGLSITGNVMVDQRALGEPGNVVIENERDFNFLQQWAQAGTKNNTALWMQINHPGKQAPRGLNKETVAPSAIPFSGKFRTAFATPRALTGWEIEELIQRFANTAEIAKRAGFTGVQIHGGHGYLVNQFLSPLHNQRNDEWGGSLAKRQHFVLEVYAAIRERVGADFPIGIKLNSADFQRGGFAEEESIQVILALEKVGIDLIEISGGTYEAPAMSGGQALVKKASTLQREAYFFEFAENARKASTVPITLTGGFRSTVGINNALETKAIDLAGLARSFAIEPDVAMRLLDGKEPRYSVRPIKTGIGIIDRMGFMDVSWYEHQLMRMGRGRPPCPDESGFIALLNMAASNGFWILNKRLRV